MRGEACASFSCGSRLRLNVPVRVGGGQGSLEIGECVGLGYAMAPRFGTGEILLQPRSRDSAIAIGAETVFSNNVTLVAMGSIRIGVDVSLEIPFRYLIVIFMR